jgi:hypothetical protein
MSVTKLPIAVAPALWTVITHATGLAAAAEVGAETETVNAGAGVDLAVVGLLAGLAVAPPDHSPGRCARARRLQVPAGTKAPPCKGAGLPERTLCAGIGRGVLVACTPALDALRPRAAAARACACAARAPTEAVTPANITPTVATAVAPASTRLPLRIFIDT